MFYVPVDPSSETPPSTTNKTDLIPSYEEMIGQVQVSYTPINQLLVPTIDLQC